MFYCISIKRLVCSKAERQVPLCLGSSSIFRFCSRKANSFFLPGSNKLCEKIAGYGIKKKPKIEY